MHRIVLAALVLLGMLAQVAQAPPAQAQDAYPNRPIRLVVPYPAGGTADAMARALSSEHVCRWAFNHYLEIAPPSFVGEGQPRAAAPARAPAAA